MMAEYKHISADGNDLGLSMIRTITSSELPNIAQDLAEIGLDTIIANDILKEIPIINTITGVAKLGIAVRDKLLVRKIYSFLKELQDISLDERQKFLADLDNNLQYQRRVGENLVMLLDRLDDLDKPALIAKLFKSYVKEDINYNLFLRFSSIIEKMLLYDIKMLFDEILSGQNSTYIAEYLYRYGLSNIEFDETLFVKTGSTKEILTQNTRNVFNKEPLQFSLKDNAYLLVQICVGQEKWGNRKNFIASNHK